MTGGVKRLLDEPDSLLYLLPNANEPALSIED
jgi:hypothetical protein